MFFKKIFIGFLGCLVLADIVIAIILGIKMKSRRNVKDNEILLQKLNKIIDDWTLALILCIVVTLVAFAIYYFNFVYKDDESPVPGTQVTVPFLGQPGTGVQTHQPNISISVSSTQPITEGLQKEVQRGSDDDNPSEIQHQGEVLPSVPIVPVIPEKIHMNTPPKDILSKSPGKKLSELPTSTPTSKPSSLQHAQKPIPRSNPVTRSEIVQQAVKSRSRSRSRSRPEIVQQNIKPKSNPKYDKDKGYLTKKAQQELLDFYNKKNPSEASKQPIAHEGETNEENPINFKSLRKGKSVLFPPSNLISNAYPVALAIQVY